MAMTLDLDEMERLAKAATPGPWTVDEPDSVDGQTKWNGIVWGPDGDSVASVFSGVDATEADNAAYIAAANPATVLRLIEVAKAARALHKEWDTGTPAAVDRLDALRDTVEALDE